MTTKEFIFIQDTWGLNNPAMADVMALSVPMIEKLRSGDRKPGRQTMRIIELEKKLRARVIDDFI
jgi:hypothetical protein